MTRQPSLTLQVLRQNRLWISRFLAVFMALWQIGQPLQAATVYWDINGTGGAGASNTGIASGTWDASNTFFNTDSTGLGAGTLAAWASGDTLVFSAGSNASNLSTVTVSGTQGIGGLTFEEGLVTLTGGALQLMANSDINVATGLTATVNSTLDGTFNLTKTGDGVLALGGTNTYSGNTLINAGTLSISSDTNLGSAPGTVVADSINFTGSSTLQFTGTGSPTINSNRGITISSGVTGTAQVVASANTVAYGGVVTGAAGTTFRKTGAGTLNLSGNSTSAFLGALNVDGGTLTLSGTGELAGTSGVTIGNRGTLTLDNTGTNLGNRIAGGITTTTGGTLNFTHAGAAATNYAENVGLLTLSSGALTINGSQAASGQTSAVTLSQITRSAGGTLYFNGTGAGTNNRNELLVTSLTGIPASGVIIPWAVVNDGTGVSFAQNTGAGTTLRRFAGAVNTGAVSTWVAASNARPAADDTLNNAARSVNTITLDSGIDLLGTTLSADRIITMSGAGGGAFLQTGGTSTITNNGTSSYQFAFGGNEALFHTLGTLDIGTGSTADTNLTGTGGLTKTGAGTLIVRGTSTITGTSRINEGIMEGRIAGSFGATSAMHLNGGTMRLANDTGTTFTSNITVNADSTIQVDRVTAAATATTHTVGTLSIGGGRVLSVNSNDITAGTAYGLTTGVLTLTSGGATIDVANNGAGLGTMTVAAPTGAFTLTKTGAGDLVTNSITTGFSGAVDIQSGRVGWSGASGTIAESQIFSGAGGLVKSGAGVVNLSGNNTFTGGIAISAGTLGYSTVSNNGGSASNLGQGTDGITMTGGTLSFIGSTSQSTNRAINITTAAALGANGTGGATITYAGPITSNGVNATFNGTGAAIVTGGVSQTGVAADWVFAPTGSGTLTLSGTPWSIADDLTLTGVGSASVLNLNTTGVYATNGGANTDAAVIIRNGTLSFGADNPIVPSATVGVNRIVLGDSTTAGTGTLNMNGFDQTIPRIDLGAVATGFDGVINGGAGSVLTVQTTLNLNRGTIAADVTMLGAPAIIKAGLGLVTLAGDTSGLTYTTVPRIDAGNLTLDYATVNSNKLLPGVGLDMRGGTLTITGNAAATVQTVASLTLGSGGANKIDVNAGAGGAVLNLNLITRAALANDGTMRFELPAAGSITTDSLNNNTTTHGILGGWATVDTGSGVFFARNDTNAADGNIVAANTTTIPALGSWTAGINVSDDNAGPTGYSGTLDCLIINSLRFDANAASAVTINTGGVLGISSGGILMTSNAATGAHTISGGVLTSGIGELIFTQDSVAQGLTVSSSITAASGVTKAGLGTVTLSGNNDYTGITDIQAGTLIVNGTGIGNSSAVTLADDQASTLQIAGNETIGSLLGGNATTGLLVGVVDITGSNTLTLRAGGGYAGTLTGSGNLVRNNTQSAAVNANWTGVSGSGFTGTVTVDGGLFQLSGLGNLGSASAITVNKGGALLFDNNGTTRSGTRVLDSTPITLNSADGAFATETVVRGLSIRTDQNATTSETFGNLNFASGANYLSGNATGTNGTADLVALNFLRTNNATVNARGKAMGTGATADRNRFRIGDATNQTAFIATLVGGGGAAATQNINIVPWGIGETLTASLADTNMGNSLITYVSGVGFRALDFATEYDTLSLAAATDNARESLTANLTGIAGKTVNSLVLHNADTASSTRGVTGTGAGQTLTVTSGALLFTRDTAGAGAYALNLGGFDSGIQVGSTNEYVIHVVNPDSASSTKTLTASITSPLNTVAASLTKSGRGTLVLSEVNTYGAGTTINEGILQAGDLDHLGTGGIRFAGGTFQYGSAWNVGTDDLSTRTLTFLSAGATLDTNGKNPTFANGIGNSGTGGFTKAGTGVLTLNGAATYTGRTSITGGSVVMGINQAIGTGDLNIAAGSFLNLNGFNATVGSVTTADNAQAPLAGAGTLTASGDVILNRGAVSATLAGAMNLLKQTTAQTVTLSGANSYTGFTHVQLGTLSINSIANAGVNSAIGAATGENAAIRLGSTTNTGTLLYTGAAASTDRSFLLLGSTGGAILDNDGTGALTLSGAITAGTAGNKSLTLQGTAGTVASPNLLSGMICEGPAVVNLIKAEAGVWELSGANEYSGGTSINAGTLIAGHDGALGSGLVTLNGGNLNDDGTLRTLANAVTISNASSLIGGSGGLTLNGALTSTQGLRKVDSGTLTLSGTTSSYAGTTEVRNGELTLSGAVNDRLGTASDLILGSSTGPTSGILRLGDGTGLSNQTFASIATSGTGTTNAIVGGSASVSTLTINQATNTTFAGNIGGTGTNQNNLNMVKQGVGELIVSGTGAGAWTGTTTVSGGKLLIDSTSAFNAATTSLTVADGAEFSLRGTGLLANQVYGFGASAGNKISLGSGTGTAVLGFSIDGAFNTQLQLLTGQTMSVATGSTFQTAVYVGNAPTAGQGYVLIDGADANSLDAGGGTFDINPVVFNGGSFTYALSNVTLGGTVDRWVLTPTAQAAEPEVWWKGDLGGIATGVWSAALVGPDTNWATTIGGGTDALVPPDSGSIVRFSATGAGNFATTLGANLTIQELRFEAGATDISVGGANTLTIGNTIDSAGITMLAGAPTNVSFSANVALAQAQSFNIADSGDILTFTGGLSGTGALGINDNGSSTGTMVLGGTSGLATYTGATNLVTGRLVLQGGATNRLPTSTDLTMGNATLGAVLQLGNATAASNTTIANLNTGAATTNSIVGGFTTPSILSINQTSAGAFNGIIGGAGTNENQVGISKSGSAPLVLNGANTYTGATTVTSGTLQLGLTGSINGTTSLAVIAAAGSTAVFDVNGRTAVLGGALTLGGGDATAQANITDTATGGLLTLGGDVTFNATNNPLGSTITPNLITAARTFTVNDSATTTAELTLSGTITASGGITVNGTGNTIVNGAWTLSGTNLANSKSGTGSLTINAVTNTTGTGDWNITGGTVNATVDNSLNAADHIVLTGTGVQDSVILNLAGTYTAGIHQGNDIYARSGARINISSANAITAGTRELVIGDTTSIGAAAAGRVDMSGGVTIAPSALRLGGSGGQLGNVTGSGIISSAGTFSLRGGSIESGITLAGTGGITKVGDGTVTFSGTRTTSGATNIQEGNLILDYTTNNASKIGGVLTLGLSNANVTAPTALTINANAAGTTQSVTSTTISNSGDVFVDINAAGAATTLSLGAITRSVVGGTVSFDYSSALAKATTSTADTGTLGWATVTTGGTTRIGAISGGDIVQATTTTNNTVNTWGSLQNVINTAGYSGTLAPNCNTIASLTFDAAAASTVTIGTGSTLIITSGGILVNSSVGANSSTITGGSILGSTTAPMGELMIHQNNTASTLTINSNIINSSGITKSGLGALVLGGNNTFLAGSRLTINEGTVQINGGNAIGDSTILMMRSGTTLDLNNSNETIGNLSVDGTNISNGTIDLGSGTLTANQTTTATFAGGIIGTGNFVKNGAGSLTLTGNNTFSGTVVVNGGQLDARDAGGFLASVSIFTLNGSNFLSYQNDTTQRDRVGDAADFILNNTAAAGNGLRVQTNQGSTRTENIGDIRIGAGHNVVTSFGEVTNSISVMQADTLIRLNTASQQRGTVLVRGNNLGNSSGTRGTIAFDSGAQATINGFEVGGGGAATTQNISIIPWMIGSTSESGLGNSFVTNVDATVGLRPLATTEYTTNAVGFDALTAAAPSTNNVRFDTGATLTGTATAINSLMIDAATGQTVTGPANTIEITSGAILAASSGTTITHALGGFSAITTGGSRDYTTYVTSTTGTLTISSPLTSAVPLVKSGAGTLSLTNTGNLFTDVYLNQGRLLIDDLDKVNNTTGTLRFFGGGIRVAAGFADDLSTKAWDINTGGGTIDVSLVTAGTTFVNGINDTTVSSSDTINIATRSSATGSTGQLTIQGASTFTGTTIINHSGISTGTAASVILNGATNAAINGNLQIGNVTSGTNDVVVHLGASDQIVDTATLSFVGVSGAFTYFKLLGFNETVAGISDVTASGVIENRETETVSTSGTLTLNSSTDFSYNGFFRDRNDGLADTNKLNLVKQGVGNQTLSGVQIRHSGTTTISGGTLTLTDVTNWQSAITNNATLNLNQTTGTRNQTQAISGTGTLNKLGVGTIVIPTATANTYSGQTNIEAGVLSISASANIGDASATNTIRIANNATLQSTGANVDLTANRSIAFAGTGGTVEVTSTNILTAPGSLIGDVCHTLTKTGTGTLILTNGTNGSTFTGHTTVSAGVLQVGVAGVGQTGSGNLIVTSAGTLSGTGNVRAQNSTFALGSTIFGGDGTAAVNHGTLTFAPVIGGGTHDLQGSIILGIKAATVMDSTFGGFAIGSAAYNTWVDGITGAGTHDRLVFAQATDTTTYSLNFLTTTGSLQIVSDAFVPVAGQVFNLMDWTSLTANFTGFTFNSGFLTGNGDEGADLDLPDISGSGYFWDFSRFTTSGNIVVVPEPSRALLMLLGLFALGFRRRRIQD